MSKWRCPARLLAALVVVTIAPKTIVAQRPDPQKSRPAETRDRSADDRPPLPLELPLDGRDGRELLLRNFRPNSKLVVPQNPRHSATMPVVDVHTHFHYRLRDSKEALDDFVRLMDRNNIAVCISLDGKLGDQLDRHMEYLWTDYRDRFAIFANIDWQGNAPRDQPALWPCHRPGFAERTAAELEQAAKRGVSGLKLFKRFGLKYKNPDGTWMKIDDPRWDPIWAKCGELGLPIIIHTADPAAFFDPVDETNERWEELSRHPDWSFYGDQFPSRQELLDARNRVIKRHPETQFIGAHVANNPEDLKVVAEWLDEYPNLWIEPASRIAELGRQPFTSRDFLIRYQDRLLFGTDGPWPETRVRLYWRFFETRDESFPYSEKVPPPQGMWQIYGVDLPDEVLRKLYFENAAKLIPGIAERLGKVSRRTDLRGIHASPTR
ncbi:Amidohydrolase [Stieleria maiorica]|uniref:Amidohydrolase n=1 Tax=Stieleria maiorica TaxID=2795974 RepID=A0A5B9MQY7_9BACT|nr:amidohydrolase family protein [Stieleria maiorica]QEG02671.1 Amidohydrolase [Stieleria maiorica]